MRAHLVQLDIAWEDRGANFSKTRALLAAADVRPGDLVLLPELFDVGFTLNLDAAVDAHAETRAFLSDLAREHRCLVQGGVALRAPGDDLATNRMLVYDATPASPPHADHTSDPIADYAKVHPFSYGKEPSAFQGGRTVVTYPWTSGNERMTVCPIVCYDLRFPELFRAGLVEGGECFAIGANWPAARQAHWRTLAIARAIENQAFVLAVNRTGDDPHLRYEGGSIVVDPRGTVLAEADSQEIVLSADLAPRDLHEWRSTFPAWRDHRLLPEKPPSRP